MSLEQFFSNFVTYALPLLAIAVLLFFGAFFASSETAFTSISKIKVRQLLKEHVYNAEKIALLRDRLESLIACVLIGTNFVTTLFKRLKELNIHTALDTAGSLPINENIKELLNYTDLVILDIKHIDNQKCINLTGMPNTNTLNFAKYLNEKNIPTWIRQVIVPTITDEEKDLLKLKDFLSSLNNIEKIEFLPYHNLGKYKWEKLGETYPLENIRTANDTDIKRAETILNL